MRIIPSIVAGILALALAGDAAAQPRLADAPHPPDLVLTLAPYSDLSLTYICGGNAPSDLHIYNLRGAPYRQGRDRYGVFWYRPGRSRQTVAGYVPENRDVFTFTRRSVRLAVWCG